MVDKFWWNSFMSRELAINCETKEENEAFLRLCKTMGIKWASGDDIDNIFYSCHEKLCYAISIYTEKPNLLTYGDKEHFLRNNMLVARYKDLPLDKEDNKKLDNREEETIMDFWSKFTRGEIAVQCDTEEKAKAFLYECDKRGLKWGRDNATEHTFWNVYKCMTTYGYSYSSLNYGTPDSYAEDEAITTIIAYDKDMSSQEYSFSPFVKVNELEEGKIYYRIDTQGRRPDCKYRINNGTLESNITGSWGECLACYNEITQSDFIEIVPKKEKEIDWSKVPRGTKVQVRDYENGKWKNRYFVKYKLNTKCSFEVSKIKDDDFIKLKMESTSSIWKYCRIHPSVEIPNEWYKEEE